jgi:hypothetical protein
MSRLRAVGLVLSLALLGVAGCLGAKRFVGEGEECDHAVLSGDVVCDSPNICLVLNSQPEWVGNESGVCWPSCNRDGDCASGRICAGGLCVVPCTVDSAGVCAANVEQCCQLGEHAGCIRASACRLRGVPLRPEPDGGMGAGSDAARDSADGSGAS